MCCITNVPAVPTDISVGLGYVPVRSPPAYPSGGNVVGDGVKAQDEPVQFNFR